MANIRLCMDRAAELLFEMYGHSGKWEDRNQIGMQMYQRTWYTRECLLRKINCVTSIILCGPHSTEEGIFALVLQTKWSMCVSYSPLVLSGDYSSSFKCKTLKGSLLFSVLLEMKDISNLVYWKISLSLQIVVKKRTSSSTYCRWCGSAFRLRMTGLEFTLSESLLTSMVWNLHRGYLLNLSITGYFQQK